MKYVIHSLFTQDGDEFELPDEAEIIGQGVALRSEGTATARGYEVVYIEPLKEE